MKNLKKLKFITSNLALLYIENDQLLQKKVYSYLNPLFKMFYQAFDGIEGYAKYSDYKPNIVITSLNLSKKNAFEMIVDIQQINPTAIIIVLSEINDTFELLETLDLGLVTLLKKPLNLEKLSSIIESIILSEFNKIENKSKMIIQNAIYKKQVISCISNYKGLLLKNNANLLSLKENNLNIKVTKTQLYAAIYTKHIILIIDENYIVADVSNVDKQNSVLQLINPRTINYKNRNKDNKRLAVDKGFKTSISYKQMQIELMPVDVSYTYITLESSEILHIKLNQTVEMTIGFEINGPISSINEKKFTKIFATGKIIRIENRVNKQKFILELQVKKSGQNVFKKYIQQREIDIINEFKQNLKN